MSPIPQTSFLVGTFFCHSLQQTGFNNFLYFNWKTLPIFTKKYSPYLYGFHSENNFWKKICIKKLQFWTVTEHMQTKGAPSKSLSSKVWILSFQNSDPLNTFFNISIIKFRFSLSNVLMRGESNPLQCFD